MTISVAGLGAPNLKLDGLQIWIRRQFPDSHDYWDGNWLRVTAHCGGPGASVLATGSFIHIAELDRWRGETEELSNTLNGGAELACMEPNLSVTLKSRSLGHITMEVSITQDHVTQRHWFRFDIDQSYLPPFVDQCRSISKEYPIRGSRDG